MSKPTVEESAKKMLRYCFSDISEYEELTDIEKTIITKEEYKELLAYIKKG